MTEDNGLNMYKKAKSIAGQRKIITIGSKLRTIGIMKDQ